MMIRAITAILLAVSTTTIAAKESPYQMSAQYIALAPNAGGQQAYAVRLAHGDWEAGLFSNQYLLSRDQPLTGATFDWRFPVCNHECFWQFYAQVGGGVSNGGPIGQISWSAAIPLIPIWLPYPSPKYYPAVRFDLVTQFIFIQYRAVTWSYPLWTGMTVSF